MGGFLITMGTALWELCDLGCEGKRLEEYCWGDHLLGRTSLFSVIFLFFPLFRTCLCLVSLTCFKIFSQWTLNLKKTSPCLNFPFLLCTSLPCLILTLGLCLHPGLSASLGSRMELNTGRSGTSTQSDLRSTEPAHLQSSKFSILEQ